MNLLPAKALMTVQEAKMISDYVARVRNHQASSCWTADMRLLLDLTKEKHGLQSVVLDYGCGPGRATKLLTESCPNVWGVDASWQMLTYAQKLARYAKFVELQEDNCIPFVDSNFDLVIATDVLGHVNDLRKVLYEIVRVTKRGGMIGVINPNLRHTRLMTVFNLFNGYKSDPTLRRQWTKEELNDCFALFGCIPVEERMCGYKTLGVHSKYLVVYEVTWHPMVSILLSDFGNSFR